MEILTLIDEEERLPNGKKVTYNLEFEEGDTIIEYSLSTN